MNSSLARRSLALLLLAPLGCGDDLPADPTETSSGTTGAPGTGGSTTAAQESSSSGDETGDPVDDEVPLDPEDLEWPQLDCDPLSPEYCAFPFPSNVYTSPSEVMATGLQVQLPTAPFSADPNAEPWSWSDGFSPGSAIMAYLPGATPTGLPSHEDFDASLRDDSPTVLIDALTGERIAHFSELDYSANDPDRRAFMVRPASRLPPGRRYIVALRDIMGQDGQPLAASPAFAALRDRTELPEEPSVEARRALYGDIFYRLRQAGVPRQDLQLAWDFTTATDDNTTGWLLHMRDDAFAALGPDGSPPYTIDVVDTEWFPEDFLYRLEGTFEVPMYLDSESPAVGRLLRDAVGMPVANGTLQVPFYMIVPRSAETTPAALMQHGHGLLGQGNQIESGHFREVASTYGYAIFGIDWIGMATEDYLPIAATVSARGSTGLAVMTDRLHQGSLNQLLAMRLAWAGLAEDPLLTGLLDPDERYWYGISQGGILGGVYMGTTT
ncbi:MAG: hypothetical protein AB1Z98_34695, partial [Nannocystaceae bacterium]